MNIVYMILNIIRGVGELIGSLAKTILWVLFALVILSTYTMCNKEISGGYNPDELVKIHFKNTPVLDVTAENMTPVLKYLNKDKDIYDLDIYSNGGGVEVGEVVVRRIEQLKAQGKVVRCTAFKAISMGFVIFQHCSIRVVVNDPWLYHHKASGGGNSLEGAKTLYGIDRAFDEYLAKRIAKLTKLDWKTEADVLELVSQTSTQIRSTGKACAVGFADFYEDASRKVIKCDTVLDLKHRIDILNEYETAVNGAVPSF